MNTARVILEAVAFVTICESVANSQGAALSSGDVAWVDLIDSYSARLLVIKAIDHICVGRKHSLGLTPFTGLQMARLPRS